MVLVAEQTYSALAGGWSRLSPRTALGREAVPETLCEGQRSSTVASAVTRQLPKVIGGITG